MNNEMTRIRYDAFQRIVDFSTQHERAFAITSRSISQFAITTGVLADMKKEGVTQLLPIIRNKFSQDPTVLAQWETTARVERPRRKPKSKTPAPLSPDAR